MFKMINFVLSVRVLSTQLFELLTFWPKLTFCFFNCKIKEASVQSREISISVGLATVKKVELQPVFQNISNPR